MTEGSVNIEFPTTEKDFEDIVLLISSTLVFDKNLHKEYYQSMSSGEILLAKEQDNIVGVLIHRRPGKIFLELPDDLFALDRVRYDKKDIGYIAIVVVEKGQQGKGIGQLLLKEALKYQKEWGSKAVLVHCWQSSPGRASEKLFASFGFEPLKVHKQPWYKYAREAGPKGHFCVACGNPCTCDELEMIKYLDSK